MTLNEADEKLYLVTGKLLGFCKFSGHEIFILLLIEGAMRLFIPRQLICHHAMSKAKLNHFIISVVLNLKL